jgi:hypothetical protein
MNQMLTVIVFYKYLDVADFSNDQYNIFVTIFSRILMMTLQRMLKFTCLLPDYPPE